MEHLPPPDTSHPSGEGKVVPPSKSFWLRAPGFLLQVLIGFIVGLFPLAGMIFYMVVASSTYQQNRYLSFRYYGQVPAGFLVGLLLDVEIALLCFQSQKTRLISACILVTFGASLSIVFFVFIAWLFGSDSYIGVMH